jgi:hypothetical protein
MAAAPQATATGDPVLRLCEFNIQLTSNDSLIWRVVQAEPEFLVVESHSPLSAAARREPGSIALEAQWLFSCVPNVARTSQISELRQTAAESGQVIHRFERLAIDRSVEAAVFSRTRVFEGRRVKSLEAYFATRDLEYRVFVLPKRARSGAVPPGAYDKLASALTDVLVRGKFAEGVVTTISEANYRVRLYALIAIAVVTTLAALFLAIRIVLGKSARGKLRSLS